MIWKKSQCALSVKRGCVCPESELQWNLSEIWQGMRTKRSDRRSGSAESADERQTIKKIQSLQEKMDSAAQVWLKGVKQCEKK